MLKSELHYVTTKHTVVRSVPDKSYIQNLYFKTNWNERGCRVGISVASYVASSRFESGLGDLIELIYLTVIFGLF